MKNLIPLCLMSLCLISCGKSSTGAGVAESLPQEQTDYIKVIECSTAAALRIATDMSPDYDMKFYQSTIDMVLADIAPVTNLTPETFWESLSPETRAALNYELNMILAKKPIENFKSAYQSVAYVLTNSRYAFNSNTDYRIKDDLGVIFSLTVRAQPTQQKMIFGLNCAHQQKMDLTGIKFDVPAPMDKVTGVYECRTDKKDAFGIIETNESLLINVEKQVQEVSAQKLIKKEKERKLKLTLADTAGVSFDITINKKKERDLDEWDGLKSRIEFNTRDFGIDQKGVCQILKSTFKAE